MQDEYLQQKNDPGLIIQQKKDPGLIMPPVAQSLMFPESSSPGGIALASSALALPLAQASREQRERQKQNILLQRFPRDLNMESQNALEVKMDPQRAACGVKMDPQRGACGVEMDPQRGACPTPAAHSRATSNKVKLLRAPSNLTLKVSRDGVCLDSLSQCLQNLL